jgi:outer membrane protein insertion porin family
MLKYIFKINLLLLFLASVLSAEIIEDVKIKGNKRLSKESIMVFGQINLNKDYNQNDLNEVLKKIYESNFFKNVNLQVVNSILEITVVENPIIADVTINGIKSNNLNKALFDQLTLKSRMSYEEDIFLSDFNLMQNTLKFNGYYFAKIETKSILNEDLNTINLIYEIDLGKRAKIGKIEFIGDKSVKTRKLKNIIASEEARFWKFISQSIYLNYERINLDKRLLTNYYKNNGYYAVEITNSFVEYQNNGSFKLIFNINSGNKFKFNKMNLTLSDDYEPKYFEKIVSSIKKLENREYSLNKIEKVLREVDKVALSKQYEFIDASLSETIVDGNKLDISISLVDTEKFYVEKINILGNQFTIDEVIRNSFIVDEGDPFNEILFNKSINNIKSKRIFKSVETKISEGSDPNFKVIDLTVVEKPTGEISLGAGVGTSGGTIAGGIKENNFLGKGIKLNTNLALSKSSIKGIFVYEKPNFNYTDNTLYTSLKSTSIDNLSDNGYKTSLIGLSVGTGYEQFEDLYFTPKISASFENLETTSKATTNLKKQEGNYFDTYFTYALDYDLTNKRYKPDDGYRTTFYQELPVVSENFEIINSIETMSYKKIFDSVTKISFYGKAVNTIKDNDVRISKRLYVPERKLRGFEAGKIGPVQNGDYIGGNYLSSVNFNATLPNVLASFDNSDISFFIDAANLWGVDYDSTVDKNSKIRSSTGLALDLLTPIGPLNFSLSQPITKSSSDRTETFRFNLGTTF